MSGEIVYFGEESQDETRNGNDKNKENEQTNFFQNGVDRGGGDSSGGLPLHGGNPGGVRHQHPAEPRNRRALLPAPGKLHFYFPPACSAGGTNKLKCQFYPPTRLTLDQNLHQSGKF